MIQLVNVSKIYNNDGVLTTGLHNVSLEFSKNEIVAIVGESGSGKSTLLNVLTKMDLFDEGEYYYKGNETSYFNIDDMDNFRKNKVGFIFQNYNIIDSYTVLENVMLPYILKGLSEKEAKEKALELIEKVGLKYRQKNRGVQLSGGEKQRCVIARALASDCEILACDEPTGNLDSKTSVEIVKLIKEVASDKLVLIVTHNFELFKDIVTRKITIHDGEVMEDIDTKNETILEKENLNLDYAPLDKKAKLRISKNNLIYTPKKTILTSLVIFCVTIFTLFLYQSIFYSFDNQIYNNSFPYKGDDKLVVYNINREELDLKEIENISSKYSVNDFYVNKRIMSNTIFASKSNEFSYEKYPQNLSLDGGRKPINDDECILLLPNKYAKEEEILNSRVYFHENANLVNEESFTIVGYQFRNDVDGLVFTGNDYFETLIRGYSLTIQKQNSLNFTYKVKKGPATYTYIEYIEIINFDQNSETSYLTLPKKFCNEEEYFSFDYPIFNCGGYDFGIDLDDYEVRYDEEVWGTTFTIGKDILKIVDEHPYEVSLYSNNIGIASMKLDSLGYSSVNAKTFTNEDDLEHFINNFVSNIVMVISSLQIVIIYFISFIILSKIYSSKSKEYNILRTLGVSKRDMKDIVLLEVMTITIAMSIFSYILCVVVGHFTTEGIMLVFSKISPFSTFLYFVIMLLFGYFTARRFNYKLFKFSVNKTFKRKEAKND